MTRRDPARIRSALAIIARTAATTAATTAVLLLTSCDSGTSDSETPAASAAPAEAGAAGPPTSDLAASATPSDRTTGRVASSPGGGALGAVGGVASPPAPSGTPAASEPAVTYQANATGLTSGGAQMIFEKPVHDFGVVWDVQKDLPTEFRFTNTGTATLQIVDMKPDCGCTVPQLARRTFDPGESGVIKVLYSPKGIGKNEKFINLITNVGGQGVARVAIKSDIRRFVWADPPNLQFQPAKLGVPHRSVVTFNSGDPNFVIEEIWTTTGSRHMTGASDFLEVRRLEGTSPPEIEIVLTDKAPWGSSFSMAHVRGSGKLPNGETHSFNQRIMVKAELFDDLRADRTYYTLKLIPPGASFEQSARIWRESGEPFNVVGTEVRGATMPGTKAEVRPVTDGDVVGYDIILSGETGNHTGAVNGSVVVRTDVPGEEEIELRFSGLVREASK